MYTKLSNANVWVWKYKHVFSISYYTMYIEVWCSNRKGQPRPRRVSRLAPALYRSSAPRCRQLSRFTATLPVHLFRFVVNSLICCYYVLVAFSKYCYLISTKFKGLRCEYVSRFCNFQTIINETEKLRYIHNIEEKKGK